VHFEELTICDVRKETSDCVSIAFAVPQGLESTYLHFTQGQNITLRTAINGTEIRRSYSICSSPDEHELRIAVKQIPEGLFSTFANEQLKPGDKLEVLPPSGRFFTPLNSASRKNYLAFAAGSGITPILSIIKTTLLKEPHSQFTLVYGNRGRNQILFREALEAIKNKYMDRFRMVHILSRERTDIPLFSGRIDQEKCARLNGSVLELNKVDEVFLCGPEAMIFDLRKYLEAQGIDPKKIHFELFTTPGQTTVATTSGSEAASGLQSKVTVKLDGITFDFDLPYEGASILDAALAQGADLPYACKGGVCCTCRAKLMGGKVEMDANYALEPDELEAGYILTCQAHPRSDKVTVDFDAA
jgi:ring-1,2-phenylacetyl-CoA epoxidase subunit PaaE